MASRPWRPATERRCWPTSGIASDQKRLACRLGPLFRQRQRDRAQFQQAHRAALSEALKDHLLLFPTKADGVDAGGLMDRDLLSAAYAGLLSVPALIRKMQRTGLRYSGGPCAVAGADADLADRGAGLAARAECLCRPEIPTSIGSWPIRPCRSLCCSKPRASAGRTRPRWPQRLGPLARSSWQRLSLARWRRSRSASTATL